MRATNYNQPYRVGNFGSFAILVASTARAAVMNRLLDTAISGQNDVVRIIWVLRCGL